MKPTDDGGQLLSEWKCSFYGNAARGAAETAVIFDKRLVEVERKIHVLGDALGVQQPAPSDDSVAAAADQQKLEWLQQALVSANKGNERLAARVKELEGQQANGVAVMQYYRDLPTISQLQAENAGLKEENASLMAKAEAMALELESHRGRLTCNDALRTEIEELKKNRGVLRETLSNLLSQIEDAWVEANGLSLGD